MSSGGKPCLVDEMNAQELQQIGFSKKVGFSGTVRCAIDRVRDEGDRGVGVFHFYREDLDAYIMSAVPLPNSSNIAFFDSRSIASSKSSDANDAIYGEHYIGVLKGNEMGTEFVVFDNGVNPGLLPDEAFEDVHRREVCRITYKSNIAGKRPNMMRVRVPATVGVGMEFYKQRTAEKESFTSPQTLVTRKPEWSDSLGGWTWEWKRRVRSRLKFRGRARKSSKRNFQLVLREDEDEKDGMVWDGW